MVLYSLQEVATIYTVCHCLNQMSQFKTSDMCTSNGLAFYGNCKMWSQADGEVVRQYEPPACVSSQHPEACQLQIAHGVETVSLADMCRSARLLLVWCQ